MLFVLITQIYSGLFFNFNNTSELLETIMSKRAYAVRNWGIPAPTFPSLWLCVIPPNQVEYTAIILHQSIFSDMMHLQFCSQFEFRKGVVSKWLKHGKASDTVVKIWDFPSHECYVMLFKSPVMNMLVHHMLSITLVIFLNSQPARIMLSACLFLMILSYHLLTECHLFYRAITNMLYFECVQFEECLNRWILLMIWCPVNCVQVLCCCNGTKRYVESFLVGVSISKVFVAASMLGAHYTQILIKKSLKIVWFSLWCVQINEGGSSYTYYCSRILPFRVS